CRGGADGESDPAGVDPTGDRLPDPAGAEGAGHRGGGGVRQEDRQAHDRGEHGRGEAQPGQGGGRDAGDEGRVREEEQRLGHQGAEARDRQDQDLPVHGAPGALLAGSIIGRGGSGHSSIVRCGHRRWSGLFTQACMRRCAWSSRHRDPSLRGMPRPLLPHPPVAHPSRSRMNRLATLSLNNRSFIALVCIAVSIIGVFIMTTMRQELIPSVSLPQIQVMTTAPGSSSEQVQDRLTGPVPQSLSGLENVEGTSSTSEAGVSIVTVELTYGTDVARSSNQVDAALSGIEDDLPEDADPQVMAGGTSDLPAVVLSVSSDLDPSELSSRLESSVTPELERVSGVSSVAVIGAPEEIVRITPDEDALAENGLTEDDISTALDANGLSLPGGSVVDGDRTLDVVLGQSLDSIESLEQIMLMPAEDGGQEE